jgi:Trk K+ transport system NAD-binding subunit/nucleotide-binding universal stress UspA family protein
MAARPTLLIAGAGRTGSQLAQRICGDWDVRVVDPSGELLDSEGLGCCAHRQQGDATSALVLEEAGIEQATAVVACTDNDVKNLEVLKLARERFGVERLYGVLREQKHEQRYVDAGVEIVDRFRAIAAMLASGISGGQKVATNIGLGIGEIIEVEVLANSSVVGRRLMDLRPRRWLVGAIYRNDQLIVPHGDTRIEAGDRVLLIGEPDILPSVATLIGAGESEFPLHFGSRVALLGDVALEQLLPEARYLIDETAAKVLKILVRPGEGNRAALSSVLDGHAPVEVIEIARAHTRTDLAAITGQRDVGLVVVEPQPLGFFARIGLRRSELSHLLDRAGPPVLVARGSAPYRRVLLGLCELPFHMDAAQLAIDVARRLDAELRVAVVHHAELVVGEELRLQLEAKRKEIVELAKMYNLKVAVDVIEDNPIEGLVAASADADLLVLPYQRRRRSSLTRPDVAQNAIHLARCSVMVMPVGAGS